MLVTCLIISLFLNTSTVSAGITDNLNLALKNALSILEKKVDNQNSSITSLKGKIDEQGSSITSLEGKINAQDSSITALEGKMNNNPSTKWPPEVAYKSPGDTFTIGKYTYFIFSKSDSKMRVISLKEVKTSIVNLVSEAASVSNPEFITLRNNGYNVATPSTDVSSDNYALLTNRDLQLYESLTSGGVTTSVVLSKLSYLVNIIYFGDIVFETNPYDGRVYGGCLEMYAATYNGGHMGWFKYYTTSGYSIDSSLESYPVYTILPNS